MSFHHVPNLVRNSIRKAELPQHKPGLPWENWWIPTPSQLHFLALQLVTVPKLYFLCSRTCCKDLGPNGPNDKHSMKEQFWHLDFATSTVFVRLPKLPLLGGWLRTLKICQWPWNVRSTIGKAEIPQHKRESLGKTGGYLQLRSFTVFALHNL